MRQALFYVIFLALAMTVMSAPTKKPRIKCTPANPNALVTAVKARLAAKKGGAAPPAKGAAPAKGAPVAGKKVKRAGETSLCGMNIRGSGASMCQGNPGFITNAQTKKTEWTQWAAFQSKLAGNVPSKYQCDHALELQLTVKALEGANFCKAWNGIQSAWTAWYAKGNAKQKMEAEFFRTLKVYANEPRMLFYVDSTFNGAKRAFTTNFLAGRPHPSSADLKAYFSSTVRGTVDSAARAIDQDAKAIIERVSAMAMPDNFDLETASAEDAAYVCKLDLAEAEYKNGNPVTALWTKMKADI